MKNKYCKKLIYLCLFLSYGILFSQNVGINTNEPDKSSLLDIEGKNMGVMFPKINLQSITDQTTVSSPEESLIVFNTNKDLFGEVGLVYWDGMQWQRFFTNIKTGIYDNPLLPISLTANKSYTITPPVQKVAYSFDSELNNNWLILDDFTKNITLNGVSNVLINLSGMYHLNNQTNGFIETCIGVFVDNKLKNIKIISANFTPSSRYGSFNQNFLLDNIAKGTHQIKIALANRTFDFSNTNTKIVFGGKNPKASDNISNNEARMNMNILVVPNK